MAKGIDIYHGDGRISWRMVKAQSLEFAYIKAGDPFLKGWHDPQFDYNWHMAKEAGIRRGGYWFWRDSQNPLWQAGYLAQMAGDGELPPCLDLEYKTVTPKLLANVKVAVDEIKRLTGKPPAIYSTTYWIQDYLKPYPAWLAECPLWLARYSTLAPTAPKPWTAWFMWQYTDRGSVKGVESLACDMNVEA